MTWNDRQLAIAPAATFFPPKRIDKSWGYELIYHNQNYCLKTLTIRQGEYTSMHFHINKQETIYVTQGVLKFDYIINKEIHSRYLEWGEAVTISRGLPHRLIAQPCGSDLVLVESSTYDEPADSVRIS